ncbi:MAG: DUF4974 domain-containing protein [Staphylococcus sp.]|nr:DUF4974 domain-containing protein [Staphylococcus sp.]
MDKTDRLLDVIEHPETYTDAEIEAMLADAELQATFEILHLTKSSFQQLNDLDIEDEWSTFKRKHRSHHLRSVRVMSRNIAAALIIGILSVAAVAAIISVHYTLKSDSTALHVDVSSTDINPVIPDTAPVNNEEKLNHAAKIIVFDNESFETIVNRIGEHYGYAIRFSSDATKSLRLYFKWDRDMPLEEIVRNLNNFEQIQLTIEDKTIKID